VLTRVFEEDLSNGSLESRSPAMTMHLEAKTVYLVTLLAQVGADEYTDERVAYQTS
jgi:S-adenosylhomocysteine hydrolase